MAKRRKYGKGVTGKVALWIWMILGLVSAIGIGGLFVNGTMLSVPLLSYLPKIVHTVAGWLMIVGSIVGFVLGLLK